MSTSTSKPSYAKRQCPVKNDQVYQEKWQHVLQTKTQPAVLAELQRRARSALGRRGSNRQDGVAKQVCVPSRRVFADHWQDAPAGQGLSVSSYARNAEPQAEAEAVSEGALVARA